MVRDDDEPGLDGAGRVTAALRGQKGREMGGSIATAVPTSEEGYQGQVDRLLSKVENLRSRLRRVGDLLEPGNTPDGGPEPCPGPGLQSKISHAINIVSEMEDLVGEMQTKIGGPF